MCLLCVYWRNLDKWNLKAKRVKARPRQRESRLSLDSGEAVVHSGFRRIQPMRYATDLIHKKPTLNDQQGVAFFSLPIEVREMIYREILADFSIYIIKRNTDRSSNIVVHPANAKMRHVKYKHNRDGRSVVSKTDNLWIMWYVNDPKCVPQAQSQGTRGSLLPFLQSCRRVYIEAIDMLYNGNTFHFYHEDDLHDFRATILKKRAERIGGLVLHCIHPLARALDSVRLLEGFRGLRRLEIKIERNGSGYSRRKYMGECEDDLMAMVEAWKGGVSFEVELRWCTKRMLRMLAQCKKDNFKLVNSSGLRLEPEQDCL